MGKLDVAYAHPVTVTELAIRRLQRFVGLQGPSVKSPLNEKLLDVGRTGQLVVAPIASPRRVVLFQESQLCQTIKSRLMEVRSESVAVGPRDPLVANHAVRRRQRFILP